MNRKQLKVTAIILTIFMLFATLTACDGGQQGPVGPAGSQGERGEQGIPGTNGEDGKSAYELAVEKGYTGTVDEWLASLVGETGVNGNDGANGQSAYELAVVKGYTGTEDEWLQSLVGKDGANGTNGTNGVNGKSAYELACDNGFEGTLAEWLDSLVGKDGANGANGTNGKSAYELACEAGFEGTLTEWLASLVGKDGDAAEKGEDGLNGKSAYELAVENGYKGDIQSWLSSLVGATGNAGQNGKSAYEIAVENGYEGTEKQWIDSLSGAKGDKGDTGNGVASIEKTKTEGLADTYTVTYTNGDTTTFTVTNGAQGIQGIQGIPGKNGETPVITIQNGNWYIDGVDTGKTAEGVKGDDGLSAFEIYKKYHPEYTGTESEWIESLKGSDGAQGEQGVSIINAYVDAELHLWIELSNGTKIDAGYVGVSTTPPIVTTYTVTFKDWDGTVLKTQDNVASGTAATAPSDPTRDGYTFVGWDVAYNNVTENLVVTATYIADSVAKNTLAITYVDNGDNTLTVTVSIKGDTVKLAGLEGYINYDNTKLTYSTSNRLSSLSGTVNHVESESNVYFALAGATNITSPETLFTITFSYDGLIDTNITLTVTDIYDQSFTTETYFITGGHILVG